MSRIGRMPIAIPAGVEVKIDGSVVTVKGAKATLTREFHPNMTIAVEGNEILVTTTSTAAHCTASPAAWFTTWLLVLPMASRRS